MNGHTDVVMGGITMNCDDLYTRLKFLQNGKTNTIIKKYYLFIILYYLLFQRLVLFHLRLIVIKLTAV